MQLTSSKHIGIRQWETINSSNFLIGPHLSQLVFSTRTILSLSLELLSFLTCLVPYSFLTASLLVSLHMCTQVKTAIKSFLPLCHLTSAHIIQIPEGLPVWHAVCVMAFIVSPSLIKGTFHSSLGFQMKGVSVYQFQSGFSQARIAFLFSILYKIEN